MGRQERETKTAKSRKFASDRRKPIEALFQESFERGPDKSGGA
jgi:hypothetical protein